MRCRKCGCDNNINARFCQSCGSVLAFHQNYLAEKIILLLKDGLFMALCILYSISAAFSLVNVRISTVIGILMTIFLWLIFAQSRNGSIDSRYMRYISGTIYASYVIRWVICCVVILCGLLLAVLSFSISTGDLWNMFDFDIKSYIDDYLGVFNFITGSYLLLVSAVLMIFAVIGIILNVLGWRSIHCFAKSVYGTFENARVYIVKRRAAQNWLMMFGILDAIYAVFDLAVGNIALFMDEGCLSAAFIIGSILVGKYFGNTR